MIDRAVSHTGKIVEENDGTKVVVEVQRGGACGHCQQKNSCGMGESGSLLLSIQTDRSFKKGDVVVVEISKSEFYSSLFIVYMLPIFLMLLVASVAVFCGLSDLYAALFTLGVPAIYFLILKMLNKHIKSVTYSIR